MASATTTARSGSRSASATTVEQALREDAFDFMAVIGNLVPITVVAKLIGFRDADPVQLLEAAFDSTWLAGGTMSLDQLDALVSRTEIIQAWIRDQIAGAGRDDEPRILLAVDASTLGMAEPPPSCTPCSAPAGSRRQACSATRSVCSPRTVSWSSGCARTRGDIQVFVEEALRVESPFRQMMRYVPRDTVLGGVDIAAGSTALLLFGAGNRDPAEFDNPDAVDLTRGSPRHHLAFGHGIHYCVGAALAGMEARAVITALLERTQSFALDPDRAPRWVDSLLVRRHERLPLRVVPW